ncbi:MAG: metallophosphoesterase [Clostridia bacterium]|nr:metallophosphoesterase [Clostridia bacterium]
MKGFLKTAAVAGGVLCVVKGFDNRIEITDYKITSPKIAPGFNGYRILQISDFHCDTLPGLVEEIQSLSPDIIVSTGDLVHDKGSYKPGVRLMERLIKIAPVYAVTGNHDVWRADYPSLERELDALGVKTLHDECVFLKQGDDELRLAGIDDPFAMEKTNIEENIQASIARIPHYDGYTILLFHRANQMDILKHHSFDLILAGHMHGGQFRLPWGTGVCAPKSSWGSNSKALFPKYFAGLYESHGTKMIVNRGLGNPMIIPRLFNRPEITVIELEHES